MSLSVLNCAVCQVSCLIIVCLSQEPLFFCVLHLISTLLILQLLHLPLIQVIKGLGLIQVTTMTMTQGSSTADKLLHQKHEHQKCSRWKNTSKKPHWAENNVFMGATCIDKIFQNYFFFFKWENIIFSFSLPFPFHLLGGGKISCVCPVEALVSPKGWMLFSFSNIVNNLKLLQEKEFG